MKKLIYALFMALIPALMVTACKKSSGNDLSSLIGLGGGSTTPVVPVAGTFTKNVINPTVDFSYNSTDIFGTVAESRFMALYLPMAVKGSGMIQSISLRYKEDLASPATCGNVTIKMGHSSLSSLDVTYGNNVEQGKGAFKTVLNNESVTIPAGTAGNYFTIQLSTPFYYNGVDSLVVQITRTSATFPGVDIGLYRVLTDGNTNMVYGTGAGSSTAADGTTWNDTHLDAKFNFAGGDDGIYYDSQANGIPFTTTASTQRIQQLYTADEINGSGGITGIAFAIGTTTTVQQEYTVTVKLGHTTLTQLTATSWKANFNSGSPVIVANNAVFKIPAGIPAGAYIWLPLTGAFNYNGTDNLVVDVNVTSSTNMIFMAVGYGGTNTRANGSSSRPIQVDDTQYNIKFRFKDGAACVIPAGTTSQNPPFTNDGTTGWQIQTLYPPNELGIHGSINGLSLRLYNDSEADSYGNFSITIGQTDKTELSTADTFASNMDDAVIVYNGAVSILGGIEAGEWIDIPFSSPFVYNPLKNLVVYIKSDNGSLINETHVKTDGAVYPSRIVALDNLTDTTPGDHAHGMYAVKFTME